MRLVSRALPKPLKTKFTKKAKPGALAKKNRERVDQKRIRDLNKKVRTQLHEDQARARQARLAQKQRKIENERNSAVTQVISNVKAIKKLTPKQRRRARIFLKHEL